MHDVVVIGGGIAGLTAAWKLKQLGFDVQVLEANNVAGGNIRTISHEGYKLELGPYSFMGSSEFIWKLVEELGMEDKAELANAASDNRYIFRDGKLLPLPFSFGSFISTPLLSPKAKLRLMMEPFIPNGAKPEDTAWDFFVRRFGKEAATYIMGPFVSGIYAGDPKILGARAAFPKFHDFERDSGSMIKGSIKYMIAKRKRIKRENLKVHKGLYSFKGGLGLITEELATRMSDIINIDTIVENIINTADGFRVESRNSSFETKAVVCAVPPQVAVQILANIAPKMIEPMNSIPMSPVTLVHWSQPSCTPGLPLGFGFLMPRLYKHRVLGTIFSSQLFTSRNSSNQMFFSTYYGGMTDKSAMDLCDNDLLELLIHEHNEIFGVKLEKPEMVKIIRYPNAIPQLTPKHLETIECCNIELSKQVGVFLAGNYLTGVGIEHAVTSGFIASDKVADFFKVRSNR